jgi:endonuclease/exonuclease/phosphatase (EEP) superfamily protein YafD
MTNRQFDLILRQIEETDPDIVCLVETDEGWDTAMRGIEARYPHTNKCPLGNTYGMLLYSKLPLVHTETRFLVQADIPSMRSVVKLRSGDEVVLHCVHPRPPRPWTDTYARDAELVILGREVENDDRPTVVMGDLNDVAWSYTTSLFQRLSHTLDPRVGRGMFNSFHADHSWMRYPLDHVFVSKDFTLVSLRRLPHVGSDHFPIFVELAYTPRAAELHETPEMQPDDHAEARDIIEDAEERDLRYSGDEQE